jgi:hypothetical protein
MASRRLRIHCVLASLVYLVCLAITPVVTNAGSDQDGVGTEGTAIQLFTVAFIDGDLDAANVLVAPDAAVHTDRGELAGPYGLIAWVDTRRLLNPHVAPDLLDVVVGSATATIRWHADLEGQHRHGRIVATLDDGIVTEIWLLNESQLSSVGGDGMQSKPIGGRSAVAGAIRCSQVCPY